MSYVVHQTLSASKGLGKTAACSHYRVNAPGWWWHNSSSSTLVAPQLWTSASSSSPAAATAAAAASGSSRITPSLERRQQQQQHNADTPTTSSSSIGTLDASAQARRASVKLPKLLSAQVSAATTLTQLHELVADHGSRLDHAHIAKLLSRTCQIAAAAEQPATPLQKQQQQQQPERQEQEQLHHLQLLHDSLAALMAQRARHATPDTLVAAVAALGRLAVLLGQPGSSSSGGGQQQRQQQQQQRASGPTKQPLQVLADRALELRSQLSASQLAVLLWGLAKAGMKKPAASWSDAMLDAFMQRYAEAAAAAVEATAADQQQQQQLKAPLGVDSRLGLLQRPAQPAGMTQQQAPVHQHQRPLPHQHSLATDLALVLYAAAVSGMVPQQQWLVQWQAALLQQLPAANAQDLAQGLFALGVLGTHNPGGQHWLTSVLLAAVQLMDDGRCGLQALATSIVGVERLLRAQQHQHQHQHQQSLLPPDAWVAACLQQLSTAPTHAVCPQTLSCCLASLARLQQLQLLQLSSSDCARLSGLVERCAASLARATPQQLADIMWASATLSLRPGAAWLKAGLTAAARAADAGRCSLQQLVNVVWSLAVLVAGSASSQPLRTSQQLQIMVLLQATAATHQGRGLRKLGPGGRSSLAWALASLNVIPDRRWLSAFLDAAFADGLASDQLRCVSLLFCVASLDFEVLTEWLADYLDQGQGSIDLSLQKYGALAGVLGALAEMEPKQLRAAWLEQTIGPDWTAAEAVQGEGGGCSGALAMQLPPALAAWVDSLAAADNRASG